MKIAIEKVDDRAIWSPAPGFIPFIRLTDGQFKKRSVLKGE
jgi:hypothetical protein